MFTKYKKFIDKYISLNQIEWALFKSKVKNYHHKKGEIIHYAGDVWSKLMFINYGIIRAYIILGIFLQFLYKHSKKGERFGRLMA